MSNEFDLSISVELESDINEVVRKTTSKILKGEVLGTPVDTGEARGGWQTSIGRPILAESGVLDKSGSFTIAAGLAIIECARTIIYQTMWITINVKHIFPLNNGHSKQAPVMFIERAIVRAIR